MRSGVLLHELAGLGVEFDAEDFVGFGAFVIAVPIAVDTVEFVGGVVEGARLGGLAHEKLVAFDDGDEALFAFGGRVVGEATPAFAGVEIDDDDAIGAFGGGVGDVGVTGGAAGEVKADIVQVRLFQRDIGREG